MALSIQVLPPKPESLSEYVLKNWNFFQIYLDKLFGSHAKKIKKKESDSQLTLQKADDVCKRNESANKHVDILALKMKSWKT